MMTTKDYIVVAKTINQLLSHVKRTEQSSDGVAIALSDFCIYLSDNNPNFNMFKFLAACWDGLNE